MKPRSVLAVVKLRFAIVASVAAAAGLAAAVAASAHDHQGRRAASAPAGSGTVTSATATTTTASTGGTGSSGIPKDERTHPRVRPRAGGPRMAFELSFKLRQATGQQGYEQTEYQVQVAPPHGSGSSCWPSQPSPVSGAKGQRVTIPLNPPSGGWCLGRYRVTVFLQRGPYCPNGTPCPEFPTQELDTGRTRFLVR